MVKAQIVVQWEGAHQTVFLTQRRFGIAYRACVWQEHFRSREVNLWQTQDIFLFRSSANSIGDVSHREGPQKMRLNGLTRSSTDVHCLTMPCPHLNPKIMTQIDHLFITKLYRNRLRGKAIDRLNGELLRAAHALAADDQAGQAWSETHNYGGYTSYASLNDLTWRAPEFAELQTLLDDHVATFSQDLDFDLGGTSLTLNSLWVNLLGPGGTHSAHIHPHSVISGTYYVDVPPASGAIRFEDPRHAMMMAAPPRKSKAKRSNATFVTVEPKAGILLLWESWLRHDVQINASDMVRCSISFNYGWGDD